MKKTWITLAAVLVTTAALLTACKKDTAPAAPAVSPPLSTATPTITPTVTSTVTSTSTRTPLPTPSPTPAVTWCSGGNNSGTVGLYWNNANTNISSNKTSFLRIQTGNAAVSMTQMYYYSWNTGNFLRLYLYSDAGGGSDPNVLLFSDLVQDNPGTFGWRAVDTTNYPLAADTYYWLGISSGNGTDDASFAVCLGCGAAARIVTALQLNPYSGGQSTTSAPCLMAEWVCTP